MVIETHALGQVRLGSVSLPEQRGAFEVLFRAEYARVVSIAQRVLGSAGEAEDVAQEVFLSFHRRCDPTAGFAAAWLHAAAAHAALNAVRARRRRELREQRYTTPVPQPPDPADAVARAETRRRVRSAMARLRRRHAAVLALRYGGLSYAEVADALGVRVSHVGTLLRRAESALRKEIGDAPL